MKQHNHRKAIITVILITIFVLIYLAVYFGLLIWNLPNLMLKILCGIIGLVLVVILIVVSRQRLDEIKGGETDDLSKY